MRSCKTFEHLEGIKRQIDQSVCNKDYSCKKGFCPSFIGVQAGSISIKEKKFPDIPEIINDLKKPKKKLNNIQNIIMAGIGGTGVSTVAP